MKNKKLISYFVIGALFLYIVLMILLFKAVICSEDVSNTNWYIWSGGLTGLVGGIVAATLGYSKPMDGNKFSTLHNVIKGSRKDKSELYGKYYAYTYILLGAIGFLLWLFGGSNFKVDLIANSSTTFGGMILAIVSTFFGQEAE